MASSRPSSTRVRRVPPRPSDVGVSAHQERADRAGRDEVNVPVLDLECAGASWFGRRFHRGRLERYVDRTEMKRRGGGRVAGGQRRQSPTVGVANGAEHDVQGREVGGVRQLGRQVHRAEPGWGRAEADADPGGARDDPVRVRCVDDLGTAETHFPALPHRRSADANFGHVPSIVDDVQPVCDRRGHDVSVAPAAGLGSGDGQRRRQDPALCIAHVGAQEHRVGVFDLVEGPAEIPIGHQAARAHDLAEAIPVPLGRPIPNVGHRELEVG